MRSQKVSAENNFTGGLKTEFTGLNFPENSCTETYNCVFHRIGNITRRLGIDYETNLGTTTINRASKAMSSYTWYNADGAGAVHIQVVQVGGTLYFYRQTSATTASPLSAQKLASTITLSTYSPSGASSPDTVECQFADGNGYLFVFHPSLEPFYCTYSSGTVSATQIDIKIRDFKGIEETGVEVDYRPSTLTSNHQYNLGNQGWGKAWSATSSTSTNIATGSKTFTVSSSTLPILVGDRIRIYPGLMGGGVLPSTLYMLGNVTDYTGTSLTVNVTSTGGSGIYSSWTAGAEPSLIGTWVGNQSNYPSNADVWWRYKNSSDFFDPATTVDKVPTITAPATKGHFILKAFDQQRDQVSGISGVSDVTLTVRPSTGAWFAGRVWYSGVNYQEYNEDIYFSQIVEQKDQFGKCYQKNDPTSEELFDLLPSDGGVIKIPGAGQIFKLVPIQNGLLVHAFNGVWFITGSSGIGFTANDYAQIKVSSVPTISATSFVIVNGYPIWWNEQAIYGVQPGQQGGVSVENLTMDTIASFYDSIPLTSKKYARGDYDPYNMTVQWAYKSSEPSDLTTTYEFDRVLNLNLRIKAFYPWAIVPTTTGSSPYIHDIKYVRGPGGASVPESMFKYLTSVSSAGSYSFTFSDEHSTSYKDWNTTTNGDYYSSYFKTGYKLHGDAQRKFQTNYIYVFSNNEQDTQYRIRGIWNFANSPNSGTYSVPNLAVIDRSENTTVDGDYYGYIIKRHKIRGHGIAMQIHVFSVNGQPFDIIGWSAWETANQHV